MSANKFTLPSFAKINWFLRILGKRADNFHELCTLFQTVSLHDDLTFEEDDEITLTCSEDEIPNDERNLIIKAALEFKRKFGIKKGAKIYLEKNIPAPGGLGGGSSNAAVALFGLKKLWEIEIGFEELLKIGEQLGSDVPFFLYGGTALGTGRGTNISSLGDLTEKYILIVTPNVNVPTALAFSRLAVADLTNKSSKSILQNCRYEAETIDLRHSLLINDFEKSVFEVEPQVKRVKSKLLELKAECALLSGSGASVFAVFESKSVLNFALEQLKTELTWRKFVVETVSRREYKKFYNF